MGKKMITNATKSGGEINLITGVVTFMRDGEYQGKKVVNIGITLETYNPDTRENDKSYLNISAWNNDDVKKQFADRVTNAKVAVGSFLSFLTGPIQDDDKSNAVATDGVPRYKANLLDFQYNRRWVFGEGSEERNIVIGTVRRVTDKEDSFSVSIPVNNAIKKADNTYETAWYNVAFKNTEKATMADRARNVLAVETPCAILCGKLYTNEENGKDVYYLNGFDIVLGPKKIQAQEQPQE